ncbi:MAG: hypothetical protein CM1200mP26_26520 [Acidimicrobiales bacterium]|nr:MAG: hypothetical protein CM1200mP26_26520 [Acidimicrobiales bacterium]
MVPEEVLRALERVVLSNHHPRYAIEEQSTRAHGTRRQRRIEHRLSVIGCRESACVLQRRHLGMEHHRTPLHPLVVATPDDLPVDRQDRTIGTPPSANPRRASSIATLNKESVTLSAFPYDEGARIHPAHG